MGENTRHRFVADAMLGRLARWLRAAGCDTVYDSALDDNALARIARQEDRVLLTRDVQLSKRKGLRTVLLSGGDLAGQLAQIRSYLPARPERFTRCLVCNQVLEAVDKASAERRVPEYIWETQTEFRLCRRCGRIYWRGSHWHVMDRAIDALEETGPSGGEGSAPAPP